MVAPFKKINSGGWSFLQPFTPFMWIVTACFFFFVGIVVWILEHRVNDEFRGSPKQQFVTILWSVIYLRESYSDALLNSCILLYMLWCKRDYYYATTNK